MSTAFRISLDGAQQVPGVVTTASGLGTAVFDSATTSMSIAIDVQGLDWGPLLGQASQTPGTADDVNGVHIHNAARGANGGIVLDWPGGGDADDFAVSGVLADGSRILTSNWETTDANPITGYAGTFAGATLGADVPFYVNIHTVANGGGEIRGQLVCIATDGGETVNGTSGNDFLLGLGGSDKLIGGDGNDVLDGGAGGDIMYGGLGNDTYFVADELDTIGENDGEGVDTVYASRDYNMGGYVENLILQGSAVVGWGNGLANVITGNGNDNNLNGQGGDDVVIGGDGSDILRGAEGTDVLTGGAGSDILDGGEGDDVMQGGLGHDLYFVDGVGDTVIENPGEGGDRILTSVDYRLPANVERLGTFGTAPDLQLYGNELDNEIEANGGNNVLDGGAGADRMIGKTGDDTYFVDNVGDDIIEYASDPGNDTIFASISWSLESQTSLYGVENLVLQGSADLQGVGNDLANALVGNTGNNFLDGDEGDDVINGGGGNDVMIGRTGNDAYFVDSGMDSVIENAGQGSDTIYSSTHLALTANIENLVLLGSADLQGYGNGLNNAIYGNAGSNLLDGGGGADGMFGGTGDDVYYVDNAGDGVFENAGEGNDAVFSTAHFALSANVETLVLQGSADLQGYGNGLANTLYGNAGANLLDGGGSTDQLTGGAGNDVFMFRAGEGNGDTVVDFDGQGAATGDALMFVGYGAGATFTNVDSTHWQVNYNGGASHDVITFLNGASVDASDVVFA
jgi:Ca2+-binding RTX toxin-like protein